MPKTAAVLTIGSELTAGLRTDTNGPELARRLSKMGYKIVEHISVTDEREPLQAAYERLTSRYELVVSTGGLGSTVDDVTRNSAAAALGVGIHRDEDIADRIRPLIVKLKNDPLGESILTDANVLDGAKVYASEWGIAPGQLVGTPAGKLLLLPGPPSECIPLFEMWAADEQGQMESGRVLDFALYGPPETMVQAAVMPVLEDYDGIEFTVLASPGGTHAIFTDRGAGSERFDECMARMRHVFGPAVYSEDGRSLAEVVVDLARKAGVTIATAESCTGGLVAGALTDVPGSSDVFLGGIVSYSNDVKIAELGVSPETLEAHGAVSSETASEMCRGARTALGADIAVATTGVAGPGGGTDEKPVGTVWYGICAGDQIYTVRRKRGNNRDVVRHHAVSKALDLVRRSILGLPFEYTFPCDEQD